MLYMETITPINCMSCGHRISDKCLVGGRYYMLEREYKSNCNINFDKWTPQKTKSANKILIVSFLTAIILITIIILNL